MRRVWVVVLTAALLVLVPLSVRAAAPVLPVIVAPEAIVVDGWTGAVLYAKNANTPRYPASTVKIMTALVALRHHIPGNRVVTVPASAAAVGGSTAGLVGGERLRFWDLLHGMMLPSGNDAAYAVADVVAGSPGAFVALMNAEARRLHLWHTHYLSPNGFDQAGQMTTAQDEATLTRQAMHRGKFVSIVEQRSWTAWSVDHRIVHHWTNLNQLLWDSKAVDGVKTGTTPGAGACLVSSAREGGKWVIAVNMGSTEASRFTDGVQLLNFGLQVDVASPSAR